MCQLVENNRRFGTILSPASAGQAGLYLCVCARARARWSGHSHIINLMAGTEMVPETSVTFNQLTRITAREYGIIRHQLFTYTVTEIISANANCLSTLDISSTSECRILLIPCQCCHLAYRDVTCRLS